MQTAVSPPWLTVRCPCRKATLGEVRGIGGEVRRVCPKCRGWWVVDVTTGGVRPDIEATCRASA